MSDGTDSIQRNTPVSPSDQEYLDESAWDSSFSRSLSPNLGDIAQRQTSNSNSNQTQSIEDAQKDQMFNLADPYSSLACERSDPQLHVMS